MAKTEKELAIKLMLSQREAAALSGFLDTYLEYASGSKIYSVLDDIAAVLDDDSYQLVEHPYYDKGCEAMHKLTESEDEDEYEDEDDDE